MINPTETEGHTQAWERYTTVTAQASVGQSVWMLTGVDAGAGCRNPKLRLYELGDEGDEGCDDGAFRCVRQAHEQKRDVAQDTQSCFRQVWGGAERGREEEI